MALEFDRELIVYFDQDCPWCRFLAELILRTRAKSGEGDFRLTTVGQQYDQAGASLKISFAGQMVEGAEAWQLLLEKLPMLKELHWLAAKLGMTAPLAGALHRVSRATRRWCRGCG